MGLFGSNSQRGIDLAQRVDEKYAPVWANRAEQDQAALAWYFLPHRSSKVKLGPTRPRVVKWYCPFADQRTFPSGHRYCINVYTGCGHGCLYCYASAYEPDHVRVKKDFERLIRKDMEDLERFDVPAAPVHLSNSTDPFQAIEQEAGHTRSALEQILAHRDRFTTVTILTKNPLMPVRQGYLDLLKELARLPATHPAGVEFRRRALPGLRVEVSLAFWRDEVRTIFDPGAPPVRERLEGVKALVEHGVPVILRIDPLFPRPCATEALSARLGDLDGMTPQTLEDLGSLVGFAKESGAMHVVYSVAKITQPRCRTMPTIMRCMRTVYDDLSKPGRATFRGGSWRLASDVAQAVVVQPFLGICKEHGVPAKHCMQNLIETP